RRAVAAGQRFSRTRRAVVGVGATTGPLRDGDTRRRPFGGAACVARGVVRVDARRSEGARSRRRGRAFHVFGRSSAATGRSGTPRCGRGAFARLLGPPSAK